MGNKTIIWLIFLFGFISNTSAQEAINLKNTKTAIEYSLDQNQIKVLASEVDLMTLKIVANEDTPKTQPDILMPTSHALAYAIVDFSNCIKGKYSFQVYKGEEKINFTIILQKQD